MSELETIKMSLTTDERRSETVKHKDGLLYSSLMSQ